MLKPLLFATQLFGIAGLDSVVSDGVAFRKKFSLHPKGYAIDIRTRHLTKAQAKCMFLAFIDYLGSDYDVIFYKTHIHIEYQRFIDDGMEANIEETFGSVPEVA